MQQVLDNQQSINFDYNLRIDNQEVWFTACVSPLLDDSVVWVARDITERKRVEQELRESKHFIEQILNFFTCLTQPLAAISISIVSQSIS